MSEGERPDYGIDAPVVVRRLSILAVVATGASAAAWAFLGGPHPRVALILVLYLGSCAFAFAAGAGMLVWASKVGKLWLRDELLDGVPWRGDERVLDVGPGRGLLLVGAAKRLRSGKVVGVDIWRAEDESGNRPEAARRNLELEGVSGRAAIVTGDMRALPFDAGTFDVIVSSSAIHNIGNEAGRRRALAEIARTLRPGGVVAILDFQRTHEYAAALREEGLLDVTRSGRRFHFGIPARVVRARKAR